MPGQDEYRFYKCNVDDYKNVMKCYQVDRPTEDSTIFFVNKKIPSQLDILVLDSQLKLNNIEKVFYPLFVIKSG